jgi:hypothetical protein
MSRGSISDPVDDWQAWWGHGVRYQERVRVGHVDVRGSKLDKDTLEQPSRAQESRRVAYQEI